MRKTDNNTIQVTPVADVVEINSLHELEPYRMAWNALLAQTPQASFFHTYDWLCTYWRHFGHDQQLRVLIIRAAGTPIGIVPLCVRTERYQVGNLRVLNYPLSDWGTWYGPIGQNQSATMFMAMQYLHESDRNWDLMELRWSDAERSDRSATDRAMRAAGFRPRKNTYQSVSVIQFEDDWDSYLASKNAKWRHELRRQTRAVDECGRIEYIRHRPATATCGDGDPRWDLFDACIDLSQRSWQGQSTTGTTLCHDQIRDYIRGTHAAAARLGMLDLTLLTVDDQPAAFTYNYHHEGRLFGMRMGYDQAISKRGLGNALIARNIQDSFQRGDHSFDMGIGDYSFKRGFRTGVATSYRFSHYPWLAIRSQGVRLTRWFRGRFAAEKLGDKLQNTKSKKQTNHKLQNPTV